MNQQPAITIDDIAEALNISKTTVSRALSGKGRISQATRDRVSDYARIHNYIPNAAAKSLAQQRTMNLALVIPHSFLMMELPFVRHSMRAICQEAFLRDYNILVCLSTGNESDPLIRALEQRKADGVILTWTAEHDPTTELLIRRGIPFATLGSLPHSYLGSAAVEADFQQTAGCREFTRRFLTGISGKVALLGGDLSQVVNQNRLTGFTEARKDLNLGLDRTAVRVGLSGKSAVTAAVKALAAQGVRTFLCMDDELCVLTLDALSRLHLHLGQEVQVGSMCDSRMLSGHTPPVSAVEFDAAALGQIACGELIKMLCGGPYDPAPRLGYEIHMR